MAVQIGYTFNALTKSQCNNLLKTMYNALK